tara:strand:+ start:118078 stop:118578 length:501 start_codon:yes stop_codon:yes gene_type:complete
MKKNRIITEQEKKEGVDKRSNQIIESFNEKFNKIKRLDEGGLNELSPETKASAMGKMRDKGQTKRADNLYLQNLQKFVGVDIYDNFKIKGFRNQEYSENKSDGAIFIDLENANDSNQITYYTKMDYYDFAYEISRRDARLLSKIALTINPETQYRNGTGDFKIKGY